MQTIWRQLLVWLMVLAMPVQGVAAIGMLHCAAMGQAVQQHLQMPDAGEHQTYAGHADHSGHAGAQHTHGDTAAPDAQAPDGSHKCSACAACCMGAALPPSLPAWPVLAAAAAPLVPLQISAVSFIASGPERPPRQHLA